jgi:FkbM family methyltransferase
MLKTAKVKSEIFVRKLGAKFGFDFKMTDEERLIRLLEHHKIDLILDVGANTGQYAKEIFSLGYKGKIISFEPLTDAYKKLTENSRGRNNWTIAERCALGDEDGEVEINISENSVSSSILKVMGSHTDSEPGAKIKSTEKTKVFKLDSVADKYLKGYKSIYYKIDTQGYEEKVLIGSKETLSKIKGIELEMSLIKLYEGQKLYLDLISILNSYGFELQSIEPAFTDKKSGRLLQVNGIFFRE